MKIVILGGQGVGTLFLYNAISKKYPINTVIIENQIPRLQLIKRRIKRLGTLHVLNQLAFQAFLVPMLTFISKNRIKDLKNDFHLVENSIPSDKLYNVTSVNTTETREKLKDLNPDLILVSGTRIIGKKTLNATDAKFLNTHVGITPAYRGVHGGYWALAANDHANCGVTIHIVDEGIDTGEVVAQKLIHPTSKDNFVTYPILQFAAGIDAILRVLELYKNTNSIPIRSVDSSKSNLFYHPTFTGYLYRWIVKGVN